MKKVLVFSISSLFWVVLLIFKPQPITAQTIDCTAGFSQPFPETSGITYKTGTLTDPRDITYYITKVDLNDSSFDIRITPEIGMGITTSQFASYYGTSVAINGDLHDRLPIWDPLGLAAAEGIEYSLPSSEPSVCISQSSQVSFFCSAPASWDAISGSNTLVRNGQIQQRYIDCDPDRPQDCIQLNPRTAVAVTAGNQLILMVVDGKQPEYSDGVTLRELALMLRQCNARHAINLDGGGSSTMVLRDQGVVNQPSGGSEYQVANHLGVCIEPCPPLTGVAPPPPPTTGPPVVRSCSSNTSEPHPLRPYPAEICGPVKNPDFPFCAQRPWAVASVDYKKNIQGCSAGDPIYPCIQEFVGGDYSINLGQYELPLVSVNRPEIDDLTFFNRAQQHLADYLEGRSYYEGIVEPTVTNNIEHTPIWKRLGVLRKLLSNPPWNSEEMTQNALKIRMIENAESVVPNPSHHDYIVGYEVGGNPSIWGTGRAVRLSEFAADPDTRYPPEYNCSSITNPVLKTLCIQDYNDASNPWQNSIYGKLWAYVPLVTREDTIGYVSFYPEEDKVKTGPGGTVITEPITNEVSIPHLNRLHAASNILSNLLTSNLIPQVPYEEYAPDEDTACPAGPWDTCPLGAYCPLPPDGGEGGGSPNCNDVAPFSNAANNVKDMETLIAEFSNIPEQNIRDCYWDVMRRSINAGYDPAFVFAIWFEESGGSDYGHYPNVADFGCISVPRVNFDAQITCFLERRAYYQSSLFDGCRFSGANEMETFLLIYSDGFYGCMPDCPTNVCQADGSVGTCQRFCINPNFRNRIGDYYPRVHENWADLPPTPGG